jgi:hypothetical protein
MQETPVKEVVRALLALPPERVAEVYDFILFLQNRYGQVMDISDTWTEQDIADLVEASLSYAVGNAWAGDEADGPAG